MLDRPRRQEQLGRDLLVGEALRDEACNPKLLGGQLIDRARVAFPRCFAGRAQLGPGTLGPWLGPEQLESLERGAELDARIGPSALAPQVLAVEKLDAREVERAAICTEPERFLEVRGRLFALG